MPLDFLAVYLDRLPVWFFQVCTVVLFLGPFAGRALLAVSARMGWTRVEAFAQAAAPFARGAFKLLGDLLARRGPPLAVLAFVVVLGAGCARGGPDPATALEGANTVMREAKPCLLAQQDEQIAACENDPACLATVRAFFGAIADAYDAFAAFYCPNAEPGSC